MADAYPRPVDRVIGVYLLVSAAALAFPHRPAAWPLFLAGHVGLAAILLTGLRPLRRLAGGSDPAGADGGRTAGDDGAAGNPAVAPPPALARRIARVLLLWYPLLMVPVLYWELPILNTAVWGSHRFDAVVQAWEVALFGGQPALELWRSWDSLALSELLHLAYLSYYPILYVFPLVVYLKRGDDALLSTLFAMMVAFAVHYTVYIFFPVEGPYFVYPAPGEPASSGVFYALVQGVLGAGASAGTAFPSSHMALSTVQTSNAVRHYRPAWPVLAVCGAGIFLGAVYAGIHYLVDMFAGLGAGLVLAALVPALERRLR